MKVGEKVLVQPEFWDYSLDYDGRKIRRDGRDKPPVVGIVTYVHPSGRWYKAAFDLAGGRVEESFFPD